MFLYTNTSNINVNFYFSPFLHKSSTLYMQYYISFFFYFIIWDSSIAVQKDLHYILLFGCTIFYSAIVNIYYKLMKLLESRLPGSKSKCLSNFGRYWHFSIRVIPLCTPVACECLFPCSLINKMCGQTADFCQSDRWENAFIRVSFLWVRLGMFKRYICISYSVTSLFISILFSVRLLGFSWFRELLII